MESSFEQLNKIKFICATIVNQKNVGLLKELETLINNTSPTIVQAADRFILSMLAFFMITIRDEKDKFTENEKIQFVRTFSAFFKKISLDKLSIFFNVYSFLLIEICEPFTNNILPLSEEYKLAIMECTTDLANCLSPSTMEELYVKENAPKLCQMTSIAAKIATNEQFRSLRIAGINCLMAIAHVLKDDDFNDVPLRSRVSEVLFFFLPGIVTALKTVALIDEKHGHKVPSVALKAWGRIVALSMQDYNAADRKINLNETTGLLKQEKFTSAEEMTKFIENSGRTPEWFKSTDLKLQGFVVELAKLVHHSHKNVRLELLNVASLLLENCANTMPSSSAYLVDIIIALSGDSDETVCTKSKLVLNHLSSRLNEVQYKTIFENLEENFYKLLKSLPRKFNAIDERVQIVALNSLIGYVDLFNRNGLTQIMHSLVHLNNLMQTLVHISEFNKSDISILEEYSTTDFNLDQDVQTSWKKFRYFYEPSVIEKIETLCRLLARHGDSAILSSFLLDLLPSEQRKEAIFLLNGILLGLTSDNVHTFKNIISAYIDGDLWYPILKVMIDDYGDEHTLSDVQNNIIQVCLLVEGIGKAALALGPDFKQFLLKTLYIVLERAGSPQPLVRNAGLQALANVSKACGYKTITDLINDNIDYFSFHIQRKLNRSKGGLEVLSVVIKYSTKEVLDATCEVLQELVLNCDNKPNLNLFLQVFKMFIIGIYKWLEVKPLQSVFKTKRQKQDEFEEFQVSNIDPIENFSDDIMGKSAEEMFKEDMQKSKAQLDEELYPSEEYKKAEPPKHIKLIVLILSKSLHYLPSKDKPRKLLVLEILKNGLPLLVEWEDELLPIVHKVWSPLVDRFKDEEAVIVNYSFQLLVVLAKISKEFIRSRTSKEVLPNVLNTLEKLAKESYLKDKGSAYRYSQNFKLQVIVLDSLALVLCDLDMSQEDFFKTLEVVFKYLSQNQPVPLQNAALKCFETLLQYDPELTGSKLEQLLKGAPSEFEKNTSLLQASINKNE